MFAPERDEKDGWRREGDCPAPSRDDVERWLAGWLKGRTVRGVELMAGGLMNRNCRVSIEGSADVVLRLYDRDPTAAATERAVLELLGGDLPVPAVLFARIDAQPNRPPLLVLALVDGVPLIEVRRSGDTRGVSEAAFDTGRLLARLQRHRFERVGLLTPTLSVDAARLPIPLTTESLIAHFAQSDAFRARAGRMLVDDVLRCARQWDAAPTAPPLPPTLTHGDFNSRNIFVRRDNGTCRVSAILDWEFAFAGSLYVDIGNLLRYDRPQRPRFEPAFSDGLRAGGVTLDGDWRRAARMADLPALCALLSRASTPDTVVVEVLELVRDSLVE